MAKYSGTLRRNDLEGGHWQLVTDDGTAYVLDKGTSGSDGGVKWVDGLRVEVAGDVDKQMLSFA
ncbi:MAG: hypothetical protein H7X95_10115, partial [Deltaproteobacteria bacterium]|nr:hypothetical protein [Deltaproteobacteria bacterium]